MNHVERVLLERRLRGLSARAASVLAGISNTTWSNYEKSGNVTETIREGVARAFDWGADWPEAPPAIPELSRRRPDDGDVRGQVAQLAEAHQETAETLAVLLGEFAALKRRVDGIEDQRVAR